mgnify:CR=1 FL=1
MINVIKKMKNIGMYAFLILVTFISVFPLYWMVSASTNKSVDVAKGETVESGAVLATMNA